MFESLNVFESLNICLKFCTNMEHQSLECATICDIVGAKYQINEKLGAGAFGIVYAAKNLSTRDDVAVKYSLKTNRSAQVIF